VDRQVGPVIGGEGGAEGARGIHGGSGEGADHEDTERDGEPDAEACDGAKGAAFIESSGEDDEDEEKGGDGFEEHGGARGEIAHQFRSAESYGSPGFLGNDGFENKSCGDGAKNLRSPIQKRFEGADAFGNPEPDAYGGIKMAAGNVAEGRDPDGEGGAGGPGDAKKADAAGALEIAVRTDGAGAEENEREGAEKFRYELLEGGVHGWEILAGRESTVDSGKSKEILCLTWRIRSGGVR